MSDSPAPPSDGPADGPDSRPGRPPPARPSFLRRRLVSLLLAGTAITLFVLTRGWEPAPDLSPWLLDPEAVRAGELWRLATGLLVAPHWLAFAISLWVTWWMLPSALEDALGSWRLLVLTLTLMFVADSVDLFFPADGVPRTGRGLFLGDLGAILATIYIGRGGPIAFIKDPNVLRYGFLIGLYIAIDLNLPVPFTPAPWAAFVVGIVIGLPLAKGRTAAALGGSAPIANGLAILILLAAALAVVPAVDPSLRPEALPRLGGPDPRALLLDHLENKPASPGNAAGSTSESIKKQREAIIAAHEDPLTRGTALLEAGFARAAVRAFEARVDSEPGDALGHALLGRAYLADNNPISAAEHLEEAIRLDGAGVPEAHYWLALARYRPQRRVAAFRAFLDALGPEPAARYRPMVQRARTVIETSD